MNNLLQAVGILLLLYPGSGYLCILVQYALVRYGFIIKRDGECLDRMFLLATGPILLVASPVFIAIFLVTRVWPIVANKIPPALKGNPDDASEYRHIALERRETQRQEPQQREQLPIPHRGEQEQVP